MKVISHFFSAKNVKISSKQNELKKGIIFELTDKFENFCGFEIFSETASKTRIRYKMPKAYYFHLLTTRKICQNPRYRLTANFLSMQIKKN